MSSFEGLLEASGAKFVYVLDPDRPEGRIGTMSAGWRMSRLAARPAQLLATCCTTASVPPGNPSWSTRAGSPGGPSRLEVRPGPDGQLWVGGPGRGRTLPRRPDVTAAAFPLGQHWRARRHPANGTNPQRFVANCIHIAQIWSVAATELQPPDGAPTGGDAPRLAPTLGHAL
jgi:hypothetical protein